MFSNIGTCSYSYIHANILNCFNLNWPVKPVLLYVENLGCYFQRVLLGGGGGGDGGGGGGYLMCPSLNSGGSVSQRTTIKDF